MSSGQSERNGSSVEPGLPNTFLMPKARNRSKVACLTVRGLVVCDFFCKINRPSLSAQASPRPACGERSDRIVRCDPGEGGCQRGSPCGKFPHPNPPPRPGRGSGPISWPQRTSPRRRALHRGLAVRVRGPQLHGAAIVVGVDGELAAFEQGLYAAIGESFRRLSAGKLGREFDNERRLQRSVENQSRIAFDLGDVVAVVMDTVTVEGQRR